MQKEYVLNVLHYAIDLGQSAIKYNKAFTQESLKEEWSIKSGHWYVSNGWLTGVSDPGSGGMVFSKAEYKHDLVMEFTASNVEPSTHDLDFMWHAAWDEQKQIRSPGYVVGINGWWEQKVGFEKAPDNLLYAATPIYPVDPKKEYKIHAGSVQGLCFLFINGRLILELRDPDPIDYVKYSLVGFETYQSKIKVRDLKIYEPYVTKRDLKYNDEF